MSVRLKTKDINGIPTLFESAAFTLQKNWKFVNICCIFIILVSSRVDFFSYFQLSYSGTDSFDSQNKRKNIAHENNNRELKNSRHLLLTFLRLVGILADVSLFIFTMHLVACILPPSIWLYTLQCCSTVSASSTSFIHPVLMSAHRNTAVFCHFPIFTIYHHRTYRGA